MLKRLVAPFVLGTTCLLGLVACGSHRATVYSDNLVTLRLPNGHDVQVDIVGEPFTGQNYPFEMAFKTTSASSIRLSIEDVLYEAKDHKTYELLTIGDPAVFKKSGIALMSQGADGHVTWSVGEEPTTLTGDGQRGPEAIRLVSQGYLPFGDFKAITEVDAEHPVVLHLAAGGERKLEIASPYRILGVAHPK
ncbi:MAG: hypothetical protein P4L51_14110 [Puia sp.]|nr:hypothetical protein [Puia sp.]